MTEWDAPNQQVVRPDQSHPSEVGTGGEPGEQGGASGSSLDGMTKDELLAYAQQIGVSPANASMTKDDLRAGIDAKLAEA